MAAAASIGGSDHASAGRGRSRRRVRRQCLRNPRRRRPDRGFGIWSRCCFSGIPGPVAARSGPGQPGGWPRPRPFARGGSCGASEPASGETTGGCDDRVPARCNARRPIGGRARRAIGRCDGARHDVPSAPRRAPQRRRRPDGAATTRPDGHRARNPPERCGVRFSGGGSAVAAAAGSARRWHRRSVLAPPRSLRIGRGSGGIATGAIQATPFGSRRRDPGRAARGPVERGGGPRQGRAGKRGACGLRAASAHPSLAATRAGPGTSLGLGNGGIASGIAPAIGRLRSERRVIASPSCAPRWPDKSAGSNGSWIAGARHDRTAVSPRADPAGRRDAFGAAPAPSEASPGPWPGSPAAASTAAPPALHDRAAGGPRARGTMMPLRRVRTRRPRRGNGAARLVWRGGSGVDIGPCHACAAGTRGPVVRPRRSAPPGSPTGCGAGRAPSRRRRAAPRADPGRTRVAGRGRARPAWRRDGQRGARGARGPPATATEAGGRDPSGTVRGSRGATAWHPGRPRRRPGRGRAGRAPGTERRSVRHRRQGLSGVVDQEGRSASRRSVSTSPSRNRLRRSVAPARSATRVSGICKASASSRRTASFARP